MTAPKSASALRFPLLLVLLAPLAHPAWIPAQDQAGAGGAQDGAVETSEDALAAEGPEDDALLEAAESNPFGTSRTLELSLDGALRVAATNDIGLQIQDAQTEAAYFTALGSWGAFDVVFSATGGLNDSKNKATSDLDGGVIVTNDVQTATVDFSRPLEWGGSFGVNFSRRNAETNNQFVTINPSTTDVVRLTYSQPLLRGFGYDYGTSQQQEAEVQFELQREIQRQARQDLLLATANAYWDLVLALHQLDVSRSSLGLAQEQLERDTRVYRAGLGTEVEVLQSTAQVERNKELLLQAETAVSAAEDALKQILFPGTDASTWDTRIVPITDLPSRVRSDWLPSWTDTFALAADNRAEVRQRHLEIAISEIRMERAVNERRPGLDLDLSASSQGFSGDPTDAFTEAVGFDFPTYGASLVFNTPLQNRTARNAVSTARANLRGSKLALDQTRSVIVGEVRDALRQLHYQAAAVQAAVRSVEASSRQLEAEKARNREGISTNFQVLQFQDQYVQALDSENTARVNYMKAQAAFAASKGVLGEEFE